MDLGDVRGKAAWVRDRVSALRAEIGRAIVGHAEIVDGVLTCLACGGHALLEGVPGLGKTTLIKSLGRVLDLPTSRIQFTPDLMPADIIGTNVLVQEAEAGGGGRLVRFQRGPVFACIVLADEINRATPKTQSALLEAMAEMQVTVAGTTYRLAPPFFVLATLNPIEMEGTYSLPEAQLDRFLFKVVLGYPSQADLQQIIGSTTGAAQPTIAPVFTRDEAPARIEALRALVREVLVAPPLEAYAAALIRATMPPVSKFAPSGPAVLPPDDHVAKYVSFGSSPRGGQALLLGAKVGALLDGRVNVTYDDIDRVARPALVHRLILNFAAVADGIEPGTIIERILHAARPLRR